MGIFSMFKKNDNKVIDDHKQMNYAENMQGRIPAYYPFGESIMNDETVYSITRRIVNEYAKLNPRHIRTVNGKQLEPADNNINALLKFPNNRESIADFLMKAAHIREDLDNVFIYPAYDKYVNKRTNQTKKVWKEFRILQPRTVTFYEDDTGTLYVEFEFKNGYKSGKLLYDEIIHWRKNYGENEFLGGNEHGMPNNTALLNHLRLNDKLLQSTIKTINSSLAINGVLKFGGVINQKDRERARLEFEEALKKNESGIIAIDSGGSYENMKSEGKLIDKDTLLFMDTKTRRHYGVSEAILDGDFTPEQKEAFYESVLEEGIITLGLAFTRVLFTPFERANGNEIIFYSTKVQMMSHSNKIALANLLMPVGGVTPNMVLDWFGLEPFEGGDDRYRSLNWIRNDIADAYKLKQYNTTEDGRSPDLF